MSKENNRFFKEQFPYKKEELDDFFGEKSNDCIRKLKSYGIINTYKSDRKYSDYTDLEDLEIIVDEDDNETECYYVFKFVGVIIVNGKILKCFPKYISKDEPLEELKQVLQVLEKFNAKEQIVKMYVSNQKDSQFNRLAAMVFFLTDYFDNGIYQNQVDILETNGYGEINWNRTINDTYAILQNNQPYYVELQTTKHLNNDRDYIKRLHEAILTLCCRELKECSLLELLGLTEIELSDETIDDFGEKEYILNQLEKEMNVQFNTRKLSLLKAMHMFINDDGTLIDNSTLSLFGTNAYHVVWEKVCAEIMGNILDDQILGMIEKPKWVDIENNEHPASKTLIPDTITIFENTFIIFDAKYYKLILEPGKEVSGNPGIGDVTKQYLYQLAFKDYIKDKSYVDVKNCFLMPTDEDRIINKGYVKLNMLSNLELKNIQIRLLPAQEVYRLYLSNEKFDIRQLLL